MTSATDAVLQQYSRRYVQRLHMLPREKDLDPVLARTLIDIVGDSETALCVLDAWFDSTDPWYATEGFELRKCFSAMNRLYAQGDIQPRSGTSEQRNLARKLAVALFLKPELRLVSPEEP